MSGETTGSKFLKAGFSIPQELESSTKIETYQPRYEPECITEMKIRGEQGFEASKDVNTIIAFNIPERKEVVACCVMSEEVKIVPSILLSRAHVFESMSMS